MDAIYFYTLAGEEVFVHIEHGICRLTFDRKCSDVCFVSTLIVNESSRQHGIGKQLLAVKSIDVVEIMGFRLCAFDACLFVEINKCILLRAESELFGLLYGMRAVQDLNRPD